MGIEKGEKHKNALVVVTKNMNASDLPTALKSRQALKMEDITFFETLKRHIKRIVDESKQGVRLDKIEIKGGQISKKATSLEVNTIQTREIGAGATAKTDITEKQTLKLVETYMKLGDWEDALKLTDEVLLNNSSCAEARWKQILIQNRVISNAELAFKLASMNQTDLKAIDQILSQANQEMATEILDLLYLSYNNNVNDEKYCEILKIILPYQYKNRKEKIKNAFSFAINSSSKQIFELLLSTIDGNDVDIYIDHNLQYANKAKNSADKIECLNRILKVDEGNVDALSMLLYLQLEKNEDSKTVIKTFETLLKYSSNGKNEISNILRWLALNINSADDCLLARQILRYSSEDISVYKTELIDLSSSMINRSFFEDAEYFSKLILSFDAENATAYWNICLIKTHSTKETKIINSDILLGNIPEFNKYLTLVNEDRQSVCIKIKIEQEKKVKQRADEREAEAKRKEIEAERKRKLLEEKARKERLEREAIARARRKRNIKITAIVSLCTAFVLSIALFFSVFLPMIFLNSGKFGYYVRYKKLTEFVVPEGTTQIDNKEFYKCSSLTSVEIPNSVTSIGDYAFYNCDSLTSIEIGGRVESIGRAAFSNCDSLTSAIISGSVTSIKYEAFSNCDNLTSVKILNGVTSIDSYAFRECSSLTSVKIPNSVISIGEGAFSGCSSLKEITLPFVGEASNKTNNTHFGYIFGASSSSYNAHYVPKSLKKVTITGGYSISSNAFYDCRNLTSIEIPNSVTSIGEGAFYNCNSLTIYCEVESKPSEWSNSWNSSNRPVVWDVKDLSTSNQNFDYYATNNGEAYILKYNGDSENVVIPETLGNNTVRVIYKEAFKNCTFIKSIKIPDSVTSIGSGAFIGCSSLEEITIPFIGATLNRGENSYFGYIFGAISYNYNISDVPRSLKKVTITGGSFISSYAFYDCRSLTSVEIPNSVTSIGYSAFHGCSSLEEITIPFVGFFNKYPLGYIFGTSSYTGGTAVKQYYSSMSSTSNTTYYIPTSLKKVTVSGGDILNGAFYNCSGLTSVVVGDLVTSIGDSAFNGCRSLTSVEIPDSVTSIGEWAFYDCDSLTSVVIPNSVTSIGSYAFYNCSGLTSVVVGDLVTSIGNSAFHGCSNLTSVEIPASVTSIGYGSFSNCSSLTSVVIPDSVTFIGEHAFFDCPSLNSIKYCGTEQQWKAISKGNGWNSDTGDYTITYNYTGE